MKLFVRGYAMIRYLNEAFSVGPGVEIEKERPVIFIRIYKSSFASFVERGDPHMAASCGFQKLVQNLLLLWANRLAQTFPNALRHTFP